MDVVQNINFYKFKRTIGVVEIFINDAFISIKDKLENFVVEDKSKSEENWQTIYMEQYFNADRSKKLCETYDAPADDIKEFRLVFFIHFLSKNQILITPFGKVAVTKLQKLPRQYKSFLEFEPSD